MEKLTLKTQSNKLSIEGFDNDKEMELSIHDSEENTLGIVWLSPNQCNSIITYLTKKLKAVGEPVEILKQNQP